MLAGAASGACTALARPAVAAGLAAIFGGRARRPGPPPGSDPGAPGDPGWFGPDSVAWKVQADASMFVAGIAAFALQLLHPLALAGVADHSSFAEDFLGRVERTGAFVQGVCFGSVGEAERRCERVRLVHHRVGGTAPDGRRYDAASPELLEWVHLGEYAGIAAAYRRFGALPLSDVELDRYVAEVAVVGRAVGVPRPPTTWSELDAGIQRFRPQLAVNEQTLAALRFLAEPHGLSWRLRPAWRVLWAGGLACLPPAARRLIPVAAPRPADVVACRAVVRALDTLLGEPPPLSAAKARLAAGRPSGPVGRPA